MKFDNDKIKQDWVLSGGESGTRLHNFTAGYEAGYAAAEEVERARSEKLIHALRNIGLLRDHDAIWAMCDQTVYEYFKST